MDLNRFKELPLMGILRGVGKDEIEPVIEACLSAGLKTLEVTMNTPAAPALIKKCKEKAGGEMCVGAGTVLSRASMDAALEAGASFIVMPVYVEEVVKACAEKGVPVFPGALTPSEVHAAWGGGASMVKVFPASVFGPSYFKVLKGPLDDVKLMAVGGVRLSNISEFFSSGADAVAFGASVFKRDWIKKKDFASISSLVRDHVSEVKKAVGGKA